jgi:hypothetical protein
VTEESPFCGNAGGTPARQEKLVPNFYSDAMKTGLFFSNGSLSHTLFRLEFV